MAWTRRLWPLLPGTMAGPELPPARIAVAVSRRRAGGATGGEGGAGQMTGREVRGAGGDTGALRAGAAGGGEGVGRLTGGGPQGDANGRRPRQEAPHPQQRQTERPAAEHPPTD